MLLNMLCLEITNERFNNRSTILNIWSIMIEVIFSHDIKFVPKSSYHLVLSPIVMVPPRRTPIFIRSPLGVMVCSGTKLSSDN